MTSTNIAVVVRRGVTRVPAFLDLARPLEAKLPQSVHAQREVGNLVLLVGPQCGDRLFNSVLRDGRSPEKHPEPVLGRDAELAIAGGPEHDVIGRGVRASDPQAAQAMGHRLLLCKGRRPARRTIPCPDPRSRQVYLPLSRDGGQRRGGHGRPIKAKYNAVGVEAPHAGIDRAGLQLGHLEVQSAFRGFTEGGMFALPHSELDPTLSVFLWSLHQGRSHRRNCANRNDHLNRDLRIVRILHG
jgi:hypothetical protein